MSSRESQQLNSTPRSGVGHHAVRRGRLSAAIANTAGLFLALLNTIIFAPYAPLFILLVSIDWRFSFLDLRFPSWPPDTGLVLLVICFWLFLILPGVLITNSLGLFDVFLTLNALFCLSLFCTRLLVIIYRYSIPRYCTRAIVLGVIFLGLWHSIDLRPEFTPADFPTLGANSSSSIRVLDIRPAREIWWIDADLRTVQLADNPAFEALSYEWGDERKSRSISIGGKRFRVTANLWKALHNVRHADETRTLWVDTICIDQSNNQEKSSQVPLMALIYRRARSVLLSLGKHVPPNWVRDSDASTWTSAFIRKNAEKYWERTGYWLTELMLEEYWKRCWIVQEIGFGHSIQVYADRKPIPWDSFVELATMFASKHHGSLLPNRVLRFQSLRDALYKDGQTYVLKELLETFKDSFCSINLDKILAFAGMAVDCWGECLPVNYAGGVKPRNEAFIVFQNSIADRNSEAPIEMVHNTGLVRRLLSRRQSRIVKVYKLGWLYQPGKWLSTLWRCYYRNSCAAIPETSLLLLVLEYMRAAYLAGKSLRVTTSVWIADTAETKETWAPSPGEHILTGIKTLGAIVGEVRELGPTYHDYLRSPSTLRRWSTRLSKLYPAEEEQKRARGLNARLLALLGPAADTGFSTW